MKIALAGNPNSGKTTLFNELTGSNQRVGNWPGVTVERKEGKLKKHSEVTIVDLPGIYSLSPYTLEEVITRNYLLEDEVDVVINIVDATNLERNLYLTTQLMELGVPVIVALNMMDIVKSNGDSIDSAKLEKLLGIPVVEISALRAKGIDVLIQKCLASNKDTVGNLTGYYAKDLEKDVQSIETLIKDQFKEKHLRWYAVKLLENDEDVTKNVTLSVAMQNEITKIRENCETKEDDDIESIITNQRYQYVTDVRNQVMKRKNVGTLTFSDKVDRIVTNRFLALPIFALVMFCVYYLTIDSIGAFATDWVNETLFPEIIMANVASFLETVGAAEWLQGLLLDGVIGGVGAVLGFVPQIMILFFLISILEDCGYMARIAFIMDRIFRRFGLSGKSFIPMMIGSGCSVPAVMATRTIESERDRKMTIILTPFIMCSAKLPVFILLIGAFFPENPWMLTSFYFLGIAMVVICGIILKRTPMFKGKATPFVMELPQYHMPSWKNVLLRVWDRGKAFIIRAGTVIFVMSGIIWFLNTFSWSLEMVESGDSILASIGRVIAPIFSPLGFGNWQAAVATVTGFLAKEVVVATFGVLFGLGEVAEDNPELIGMLPSVFSTLSAYSFMIFTLFAAPCAAAIGATKREMNSWKWTLFAIGFQTGVAYLLAFLVYQVGSLFF